MREERNSIYAFVVYDSESLQVVIERVANEDGVCVDEIVERFTDGSKWLHGRCMIFWSDARESCDVVAGGCEL